MACTDITRCDSSLVAAPIDVALVDNTNVLSYKNTTIGGIPLIDAQLVAPNSTAEDLCRRLRSIRKIKGDRKWKGKAQQTDKDNLKDLESKLCDLLKEILPEPVSNGGGGGETEVIAEPEPIYGCLDKSATNYYCKDPKNDCVDNEVPEGVLDVTCEYSKELSVENKYLFCNNKFGCSQNDSDLRVTPTTDIATWVNNGAIDNDHIYQVKAGMVEVIKSIKPMFVFLKNQEGFYSKQFSQPLINEFANALTVAVFKTKFKKDSDKTFPYTKVTVYAPDSQPIGQFSITPVTDKNGQEDSISSVKSHTSSQTLNKRLRNEVGVELLNPNLESAYINFLNKNFPDTRYTFKGGKVVDKEMNEGLISVLKKVPIGLAKLLN